MTLVELLIVIAILIAIAGITVPAVMKVRSASYANTCRHNLRQIGIALHHYQINHAVLPPGCASWNAKEPYPHMSWLTRLLPFLEQHGLWQGAVDAYQSERFFGNVPPHNGLSTLIVGFVCPEDPQANQSFQFARFRVAFTSYLGVEGMNQETRDGLLFLDSKISLIECRDGLSNTIITGERPPSADKLFGWWYAGWGQSKDGSAEMVLGAREISIHPSFQSCPNENNHFRPGRSALQCDALHFWSHHDGGAHFLFGDNSVRFFKYNAHGILPALATRAGNETFALPN